MIYDNNLEKQRIATCDEKIFFEAALMSIWLFPDDVNVDEVENSLHNAEEYPIVAMMPKKQKISLYAVFLRNLLDDSRENICDSLWADSIIASLVESLVQAIWGEQDSSDNLSGDYKITKDMFIFDHFYRMLAVQYFNADINYKSQSREPWKSAIYSYAEKQGFIDTAYLNDFAEAEADDVNAYVLEPPPSDWLSKWHFDTNWLTHHSMSFYKEKTKSINSGFFDKIKLPKKFQ